MRMKTSSFNYYLPQELIAQTPVEPRDASRLMTLDRATGRVSHGNFSDIVDHLSAKDCLILNDSRVLPARLYGIKKGTGARVEFLLTSPKGDGVWEALVFPGKKAKPGTEFVFGEGELVCIVKSIDSDGNRIIQFSYEGAFYEILDKIGSMPLPHYITKKLEDRERYQTVYSKEVGSIAAPTAGLHFTQALLDRIRNKGVQIGWVTLHVGIGTFRPVKVPNIFDHKMHSEHYYVPGDTADLINKTKESGGKVYVVGTTACRTLESVYDKHKKMCAAEGWTDIFIYPGYRFNVMDALITNFHLPQSTLMMLVSAFAGQENVLNAYNVAVNAKYRFFSFGDAMLIC